MIMLTFKRDWSCKLDPDGNRVKVYPAGLRIKVDEVAAVAAIAEGAAETAAHLSDDQVAAIEMHKRVLDLVGDGVPLEEAIETASDEADEAAAEKKAAKAAGNARTRKSSKAS